MFWIGALSKRFYAEQIGFFLKQDVNWIAAVLFYLPFIAGLDKRIVGTSVSLGAFFGLACYATYDLTSLAVAKD